MSGQGIRVHSRLYRQQATRHPVTFRGCRVYSFRIGYLLNVALVADAETVRPWSLRVSLVIRKLAGTPLGRLNEKDPNELSSEPSVPLLGSTLMLIVCGPV